MPFGMRLKNASEDWEWRDGVLEEWTGINLLGLRGLCGGDL